MWMAYEGKGGIKGEVVFLRVFDLGGTIDVKKIRRLLSHEMTALPVSALRNAPEYLSFATPIYLDVNSLSLGLSTADGIPVNIMARLYPVGGLAISLRVPVDTPDLAGLSRYPFLTFRMKGEDADRSEIAAAIYNVFEPIIKQSYADKFDEPVEPERYRAFCLTTLPGDCEQLLKENKNWIASILVNDPHPEKLSRSQIDEITRLSFSYYNDDLVVVDWDAAFVVEPEAKYEDLLYVFEVANLELMLLRKYDQYLDRVLNNGYEEYEKLLKGILFFTGRAKNVLAELSAVRMDLAEVTDELDNVTKFFGDYYLARIYMGLSQKLHITDYHKTVDEKLATLNDLYRSIVDYLDTKQNLFLEWAIVLLIVFEIIMAFVRH